MSVWQKYNPNPTGRMVGDCAVRAIAKALDVDWEQAYSLITANGFLLNDMPSSNSVWGSTLRQRGFVRKAIPNTCPDCYTAEDFVLDHPDGVYVLGFGESCGDGQIRFSLGFVGLKPGSPSIFLV